MKKVIAIVLSLVVVIGLVACATTATNDETTTLEETTAAASATVAATFVEAFKGKKPNVFQLIFPLLSIVLGLMLAFGNGLDIIIVITGALLAVNGVLGLIGSLKK